MTQIYFNRIQEHLENSLITQKATIDTCAHVIIKAAQLCKQQLQKKGKLLICGNGGSAAQALHFASELVNRFEIERLGLGAIALSTDGAALTSIANDNDFKYVFSRQIQALANDEDIVIVLTTSGQSANILQAVKVSHTLNLPVIALTGKEGGLLSPLLQSQDIEIRIPSLLTARIQEAHLFTIHLLCDLIDHLEIIP